MRAPAGQGPSVRWVLVACVALASLSLLLPHALTYDAWAWVNWGREITELDLDTREGPSWKPLPVLFTTLFAVAGDAAPELWLVLERTGGLLAVAMTYRVAARLVGPDANPLARAVGGAAGALALLSSSGWVRYVALGAAEPLVVALVLWSIERHLDGRRDHALALGFAGALMRPEVWPFLGVYAVYVWFSEPACRRLAVVLLALVPALWFLPELWGSGDLLRASSRAREPDPETVALSDQPVLEALRRAGRLVILPVQVAAVLAVALAVRGARRGERLGGPRRGRAAPLGLRRRWRSARGVRRRRAADRAVLGLGALALAWMALVVAMAAAGYPGVARFVVPPAAILCVLAGVGIGRVWELVGGGLRAAALFAVLAAVALPFALPRAALIPKELAGLGFEAQLQRDLDTAVERAGGPDRVLACGDPYAGIYDVPALAWRLRVHGIQVGIDPRSPGVVFRANPAPRKLPTPSAPPANLPFRPIARAGEWEVLAACRGL